MAGALATLTAAGLAAIRPPAPREGERIAAKYNDQFGMSILSVRSSTVFGHGRLNAPSAPILTPLIVAVCAVGSYAVHDSMIDIWYMLGFGVIGYVFKKLDYPLAPLVLALVLGDRAEDSFRQAMLIAQGDLGIFFSNALVGSITALALVMLFWPLFTLLRRRWRIR